jgi:uncharacterized RmlC-like cupin family protein
MSPSRRIAIHHPEEGMPGEPTPDAERRGQWEREGRWAAWIRNEAGDASGWHHHAANETYVYVSRGTLTLQFGTDEADAVVAHGGDFIFVPAYAIHRESTGPDEDLEAFVIRIGGEPEQVNVEGPDAAGADA